MKLSFHGADQNVAGFCHLSDGHIHTFRISLWNSADQSVVIRQPVTDLALYV